MPYQPGALDGIALAADLLELADLYAGLFARVPDASWDQPPQRSSGWTLRQTIAHLDAVGLAYLWCTEAALDVRSVQLPGIRHPSQLDDWNKREIAARAYLPPVAICDSYLATLGAAARLAANLSAAALDRATLVPLYAARMRAGELLGAQLAHAGLVHAAQVAALAGIEPLWRRYRPALLHRQITRLCHVIGHAYRTDRGGDRVATVNVLVGGPAGGAWHVTLRPEGGHGGAGRASAAQLTLAFDHADLFCRLVTLPVPLVPLVLAGRVRIWGDVALAMRFRSLFAV